MTGTAGSQPQFGLEYQYIDCKCLAQRWGVPESWVRDQVRGRSAGSFGRSDSACPVWQVREVSLARAGIGSLDVSSYSWYEHQG